MIFQWITFKECLIMKSPIAMLHGLIQEYGRRTEDPSIIRSLNQLQTSSSYHLSHFISAYLSVYMETLTSSITDETSWLEAATFTRTMLKEVNDRLQKLYNENPGAWNQQFPDMDGFYKENVEKRLKEVYDTLGECYKALTPCDFSDVKCHWRWIVLGELSQ